MNCALCGWSHRIGEVGWLGAHTRTSCLFGGVHPMEVVELLSGRHNSGSCTAYMMIIKIGGYSIHG